MHTLKRHLPRMLGKLLMSYTHIWGCSVEIKIYNPNMRSMDSQTISGYFISYLERSRGYMFYYSKS